jgi:hypothetical protein
VRRNSRKKYGLVLAKWESSGLILLAGNFLTYQVQIKVLLTYSF